MATSGNEKVKQLKGVRDPLERARLCQQFLSNLEAVAAEVRVVRNEAICAARTRNPDVTRDELAERIGAKKNVVVDALRGKR